MSAKFTASSSIFAHAVNLVPLLSSGVRSLSFDAQWHISTFQLRMENGEGMPLILRYGCCYCFHYQLGQCSHQASGQEEVVSNRSEGYPFPARLGTHRTRAGRWKFCFPFQAANKRKKVLHQFRCICRCANNAPTPSTPLFSLFLFL